MVLQYNDPSILMDFETLIEAYVECMKFILIGVKRGRIPDSQWT